MLKFFSFLCAVACIGQGVPLVPDDLAGDVGVALRAGETAIAVTDQLVATISGVDDVLMLEVQVLVGNIIANLFSLGVSGLELQSLQTTINHAEAVSVFQLYQQANALLEHKGVVSTTQTHLESGQLTLTSADRSLVASSQAQLEVSFPAAMQVITGEVTAFNDNVNQLIEGLSGPPVLEIRASLLAVNRILGNTRNQLNEEKAAEDAATAQYLATLDIVIAQVPNHVL